MKDHRNNNNSVFNKINLTNLLNASFLILIFSIPFLRPELFVFGHRLAIPEIIFVCIIPVWTAAVLLKKTSFRWHRIYWLFLLFFVAILASALSSADMSGSLIKALGTVYLIGLAILSFNVVRTPQQLKRASIAWLAGTIVVVLLGVISIALFYLDPQNFLLKYTLSHYGAVPVGNYPRVMSTLYSSSLLLNYLVVSLCFLFISNKFGWIGDGVFYCLYFFLMLTAVMTISIGLGGIALMLGIWIWILFRKRDRFKAAVLLAGGIVSSIFFFILSFFALESYSTSAERFRVPFTDSTVQVSSRYLVWSESLQTFLNNPLTGVGIGEDSCMVIFANTDGTTSFLTDAHNTYLSIASQTGIIGLFALILLIYYILREFLPPLLSGTGTSVIRNALGLAFVVGFVYQGLFGSFEDARHLWILIGFILSFGFYGSAQVNRNPGQYAKPAARVRRSKFRRAKQKKWCS